VLRADRQTDRQFLFILHGQPKVPEVMRSADRMSVITLAQL